MTTDEEFMKAAIEASRQAYLEGNMPFGAVLVKGDYVHVSRNNQILEREVTGHAEVVLVREVAAEKGREFFAGSTCYASGEPCAMCSGTLFWAGVSRIVFAAPTKDIIEVLGGPELPIKTADVLVGSKPLIPVEGPLLKDEAVQVLRDAAIAIAKR
jgi:tRNA(adenine34) deaminase